MEPTRNAWVPLAAWFRRHGAAVVVVPPEQSSSLRDYYNKYSKTDRLDAEMLARLPVLHPEGLHAEPANGPGDPLKRAVKLRSGLVRRRSTCMHRLAALLEIMGPGWVDTLGSDMTQTAFKFLAKWAHPHRVKRLGRDRLGRWFQRETRKSWGPRRAEAVVAAAEATLALWGDDGLDWDELAADIAVEATVALAISRQIAALDRRIFDLYCEADPAQVFLSAPGVGRILAAQIRGRLGDPARFANLSTIRSYSGLVPRQNSSGLTHQPGGPTKQGDACLREALFLAADTARKVDPQLAARYQRLMCETGRHHTSALCNVAAVLLTRIAACARSGTPYQIRDMDGRELTAAQGRQVVLERYAIPLEVRAARRTVSQQRSLVRRDERARKGVAERSEATLAPLQLDSAAMT
jgi:transposase